ncbi:DUF222 domain-containing protein [Nocardioides sp.]|uniref:DUF222 domain-containing protein n=1 Tax=Nocardioides sp. TaxID=35761 RepID=UPI0035B20B1B
MTAIPDLDDHGMVASVRWVEVELEVLGRQALWPLSAREVERTLESLTRARAKLDALLMRMLVQGEAVGAGLETGATSTTNWWSHTTRVTRAEAHRTTRLAKQLEEHEAVAEELVAGELRTDQARVIVDAVDALPDDVDEWVPRRRPGSCWNKPASMTRRPCGRWAGGCWRWSTRLRGCGGGTPAGG